MKNKLLYLIKMSLKKKVGTKWFIIANAIIFIAIASLVNIDTIVKFFGGDFEDTTEIMVIDEVGIYDDFVSVFDSANSYLKDTADTKLELYDKSLDDAKKEVKDDNNKVVLVINSDDKNYLKADLISYEGVDIIVSTVINSTLNSLRSNIVMTKYNINTSILSEISTGVEVTSIRLDEKDVDEKSEAILGAIFPIIILPFFMLCIFLINMIGAEVNEEKSSKSMEIIISNVSPKIHFFSKVIAGNTFVLLQGLLLFIYAFVGVAIRFIVSGSNILGALPKEATDVIDVISTNGLLDKLIYIVPLTLILMIITFVGYSLLAGILASMTTNQEDYQQLQTPIILISLAGYYMSMMAMVFDGSLFLKLASYIPFISALLSPVLLFLNQISIIDVLISIAFMLLIIWVLVKYGLRIYKVGILNYSSTGLWKKMFKAMKKNK